MPTKLSHSDNAMYSDAETVQRREAALKQMLNTPHQPHETAGRKRKPPKRQGRAKLKSGAV